jgi:hypothetical protein
MVFENKELRISGPKRDKVTGDWRRLHNEEFHDLYSSPNIICVIKSRRLRWAGHIVCMKEKRNAYRVLLRKPEGNRPLGRPWHRWEDNIKVDLKVIVWEGMEWINLTQGRNNWPAVVNMGINLWVA